MREICFDVETTGLDPGGGDRIVEIGCVELMDLLPTGQVFHARVNPQRSVSAATTRITGLSDADLQDCPVFADAKIVDALLQFIGDAPLIAHNAGFDRSFLNAELSLCSREPLDAARFIDTLEIARSRFPGQGNSLDALCRRFDISLKERRLHGALKDAQLLGSVYLELRGGREQKLDLARSAGAVASETNMPGARPVRPEPLPPRFGEALVAAHKAFIAADIGEHAFWRD